MLRFVLEDVSSGSDAGLWVSLGFSSDFERNDVLHIVSGDADVLAEDDDKRLYVERFDQAYSCPHGGERVLVRAKSIEVALSDEATRELDFTDGVLVFDVPRGLDGYPEALRVLGEMSRAGSPVRVDT